MIQVKPEEELGNEVKVQVEQQPELERWRMIGSFEFGPWPQGRYRHLDGQIGGRKERQWCEEKRQSIGIVSVRELESLWKGYPLGF
jgi:hypothetical protein